LVERLKKNRTKIISIVIVVFVISFLLIIYHYEADYIKYHKNIADEDFEVKFKQSIEGFKKEVHILGTGKFITTTNFDSGETTVIEGEVDRKQLKKFIRYSLEKGIIDMRDDMFAEGVFDGSSISVEMRLGKDTINCGGYMPELVSKNFKDVMEKLNSIIDLY
jgi:hypothetical protein